ncbi:MAG: Zinc-binding alcohol dehydrogenase family protein [Acetothermia bacterium 64_32]|nr:MAG: Zinc-binding alcohol dehydrogenase family protein [Acetothermia bacterium 64_32]HAF69806.1 alcohol dehydrogenase [Candidatus Acetothermia bacterium]
MRALVLERQAPVEERPLLLREVPAPEPGPGEVLVEVSACGVCHTDLHLVEGDLPMHKSPVIPGHQVVGRLKALGRGVRGLSVGDRVGVAWLHWACGKCRFCRRGLENLCENALFTGWDVDGGFAQEAVARAEFVYPIPHRFPDAKAAPLLCAGIVGYRALKLAICDKEPGRLGLYGFGASAHIAIQIARHLGWEVYVFTRSPQNKALARELGAVWVGEAQDRPPKPLEAAVIYAPAGWIVPEALRSLDKGGRLSLAGIHMTPIPELPYGLLYHEREVRSVANATGQDAQELLRYAAEIPIEPEVQTFPLDAANDALQMLKGRRLRGAAVLVT